MPSSLSGNLSAFDCGTRLTQRPPSHRRGKGPIQRDGQVSRRKCATGDNSKQGTRRHPGIDQVSAFAERFCAPPLRCALSKEPTALENSEVGSIMIDRDKRYLNAFMETSGRSATRRCCCPPAYVEKAR